MKCEVAIPVSIAVASLALVCLLPAQARASMPASSAHSIALTSAAKREAMEMVPVQTSLMHGLDARKEKPGEQFKVKLRGTAHLKNGPELPSGTTLIGTVATDHMRSHGTSRLALRITEARLKDGKMIPIKATIVNVAQPLTGFSIDDETVASTLWSDKTIQVDELNAISGIDLHSNVAAKNSGVFVSNRKDDVKLDYGIRLTLAIAARGKAAKGAA
ncbi:MAG TPA: hypothetical protein VMV57_11585 [Terracidiphilus sp.]|nr:hypothetical protein [Terracidiphilus sp.]